MPHITNGIECRTAKESLKYLIKQAKAGKIGPTDKPCDADWQHSCAYIYPSGNHCAIGALFSKAQLDFIEAGGDMETSIKHLTACRIGERNVEAVTGLPVNTLQSLQTTHDRALGNRGPEAARNAVIYFAEKMLQQL